MAQASNTSILQGIIYDAHDTPLANVIVEAYDKDLRSQELLGEAKTDALGRYEIKYDNSRYAKAEGKSADVYIWVYAREGRNTVELGRSPIYFNAPKELTLDFKVGGAPYKGTPEFDALVAMVQPLLERQHVQMVDLQEEGEYKDISFLAGETGEDAAKIALLPLAYRYATQASLPPDFFYGLFRMQYPRQWNALPLVQKESLRKGLKLAIEHNIISSRWEAQVDHFLGQLDQLATAFILTGKEEKNVAFQKMISAALPQAGLQKTFVDTYLAHETTPEKFWEALAKQEGFRDKNVIEETKILFRLNHLTHNEPALTSLLFKERSQDPALKEIRGFAKFTRQDWENRIAGLVATGELKQFPEGIEGDTPEEKTKRYARAMEDTVRLLYPAGVFVQRMKEDSTNSFGEATADVATFLSNNPDFELQTNRINHQFESSNWAGVQNREALKTELKSINRLYKLAPRYEEVSALRKEGIGSASDLVQQYSEQQFIEKFSGVFDQKTASRVYKAAKQLDKWSAALVIGHKTRHDIKLFAIDGENGPSPDYQSMFGDNKLCDCEHCQSVYSPAAYLVDMLHFIQQSNTEAFDGLDTRRPDLKDILLTCQNTNTPLPYIDLANEVLEDFVATGAVGSHQTIHNAAELAAYPEYENPGAYAILKTATSSFQLPFNLPLEQTRLFLDKLNLKRQDLMELFFGKTGTNPYQDTVIAAEYLKLSKQELELINGSMPATPVVLDRVSTVLQHTRLSYLELVQLLECRFVNPVDAEGNRSISIVADTGEDPTTCDIEKLVFSGGESAATKIGPFIRLWKKLGWDVFDLDRAFTAFGVADLSSAPEQINTRLIVPLSHVVRLKARFNLSVWDILTFWSSIGIVSYTDHSKASQPKIASLYEQLFQNKKVSNPIDPDFANPAGLGGLLSDKASLIIAALQISQDEFDQLRQAPFTDGALNLENLSMFYRYATLARALKMAIGDLVLVVELSGLDPFGDNTQSDNTLVFLEKLALLRSTGFSLQDTNALLRPTMNIADRPDANKIAKVLHALREGLQKIEPLFPDVATNSEQAANKLENQKVFIADTLGNAFKTESKMLEVLLHKLVKSSADETQAAITPFIDADFIASDAPLFSINDTGEITWTFPALFDTYNQLRKTSSRIEKIRAKFKISTDEFIYFQQNEVAFQLLGIWNLPTEASGSQLFAAFEKLAYLIRFRNALNTVPPEWFALFNPVLSNEADGKARFIEALTALSTISVQTLEFLLGSASDVTAVGALGFTFPEDYLNGAHLLKVLHCHQAVQKAGGSAENLSRLVVPDPGDVDAQLAKGILKAKYDETAWLSVIKPISNLLRELKRNALVAYLLTSEEAGVKNFRDTNGIVHTNSLYAYFLIDLEMDACMMTSRIKQAIGSVQLFIDRCLMGLESGIALSPDFADQWNKWRKWYRIWEANRKIFLYPENWIEPELRDDKSPFFKELEAKLKQNEVTEEIAKDALLEYLEKLDVVSNLEIIGFFPDELTGIVHVFGRTKNVPHHYYYRRQERSQWTAWEKIDLDIEGDHILPVVWNNRLMLFWGMFAEKQEQKSKGISLALPSLETGGNITSEAPQEYFELKLAWSEYKNGKWSSKKISKEWATINLHTLQTNTYSKNQIILSSFIDRDSLFIRLLVPWRSDTDIDWIVNEGFEIFYFDGCNNAPSVLPLNNSVDGLKRLDLLKNTGNQIDSMLLKEGDVDSLTIYETGLFDEVDKFFIVPISTAKKIKLLNNTPGKFCLLSNHHEIEKKKPVAFIYRNERSIFYVNSLIKIDQTVPDSVSVLIEGGIMSRRDYSPISPVSDSRLNGVNLPPANVPITTGTNPDKFYVPYFPHVFKTHYKFQSFYHPYVCDFIKTLNTFGIDGLYKRSIVDSDGMTKDGIQNSIPKAIFNKEQYDPTPVVYKPYPVDEVDFSFSGSYSLYNWELFYHIPLLIATRLTQNQKFEAARTWFHYIFDPTRPSGSAAVGAERFWLTKPFKKAIKNGILTIEDLTTDEEHSLDLDAQLDYWERHPFNPHGVARLRHAAYMRTTVMKYIDNLIEWGDQLFRRDTIESINEATQLYILAANLLGKKPENIPARAKPEEVAFSSIQKELDRFSNAKMEVQSFISPSGLNDAASTDDNLLMPLFCIPKNEHLLAYWDTVADRLFKIRHCMNIQGVVRQLPLFEPPIDPALLVRAAALGLDLNAALNEVNALLPNYRFQVMLQKANELCNDVKGLGNLLLSVLEKQDVEALSLLRSGQEIKLLELVRDIKESQVAEARRNLESLGASQRMVEERWNYYSSREFMNTSEALHFASNNVSLLIQQAVSGANAAASALYTGPDFKFGGPFTTGIYVGGSKLAEATKASGGALDAISLINNLIGSMAGTLGGYQRRMDDWKFQAKSAELELKQLDKQILAAEIRLAIAEKDLENHDVQIEHAQAIDDYLRSKFTNEELYDYMVGQVSAVYFQSYQLAYETAKKAEKCMQHELGVENTSFIQFGYWDSLKKGLLSGEKLQYDLRRLELAYLDKNIREFEITKHISLKLLDPHALLLLKATGKCQLTLPEWLFDLETPGHYMRRIKNIGLSIPAIAGPYTSINCTMSMQESWVRKSDALTDGYGRTGMEDSRFGHYYGNLQSIVTSSAQNDGGLFEINFRDERYLPFEGLGAESTWMLELPSDLRQFDYNTITDVILHLRYTARPGGSELAGKATEYIKNSVLIDSEPLPYARLFSLKHDFPGAWHRLETGNENFRADMMKEQFGYLAQAFNLAIETSQIQLLGIKEKSLIAQESGGVTINSDQLNSHMKCSIEIAREAVDQTAEEVFLLVPYRFD